MAEKTSPEEAKKLFELAALDIRQNPDYDEATRNQKLSECFEKAASSSRISLSVLTVPDRPINTAFDNILIVDEVVRSNALLKAYDVASKTHDDVSTMYDKIEKLTEKYKKDPKVVKESKAEFAKLQKAYPDSNPTDGSIDISAIAVKELEFLTKTFPENMKRANEEVQKQKDYGTTLSPIETLGKIADSVAPAISR